MTLARCYCLSFMIIVAIQSSGIADELPVDQLGVKRGIVAIIGLDGEADSIIKLTKSGEQTIYFQSDDAAQVDAVRKASEAAGVLGIRVFADEGPLTTIQLGDNIADGVVVADAVANRVPERELLRVLRPDGIALRNGDRLVKPAPKGIDDWSHAYHGPDNNPQSTDALAKGSFRTQFIGTPKFSPMPEQTVIAGGRIFKAMGHIAHKANQNEILNTLLCINAYNGTILWKRPLSEGFMIHRNTMIATADSLYMGDHESCKVIDAATGKVRQQIKVAKELTDGPVWKWMALQGDTLFALVGNPEVKVETLRSNRRGLGHWPWGMWKGHDYNDPRTAFGYGRTLVAIDRKSGKLLWHYRDDQFLDARAVCMKNDRIYCMCPRQFLACIDAKTGKLLWRNSSKALLDAVDKNQRAQHYVTGYATTCYIKCTDDLVIFSGPQRVRTVAASTKDGSLAWTYPVGNLQIVLRDDAVYAAGPQRSEGVKLEYATGKVLEKFPARRACTRATGCVDSIFFRASGGTVRLITETNQAQHIAPMRPPCQDGVLISNGHLYWGPWMCGCQLSLYGNIGLCPAGDSIDETPQQVYADAITTYPNSQTIETLETTSNDWTAHRGDNARSDSTRVPLPSSVKLQWSANVAVGDLPTAPITGGGYVFVADRSGVVRALDATGKLMWKSYVGGPVYYAPSLADSRLFVGCADGRVYALEARTGRKLWSFRVAPSDRRISVFGKLISRWPVAGGIAVQDGTVYADAGIAHYDGTYLVGLDAATGKVKATNLSSGQLSPQVNSGISMQGNLRIVKNELQFLGGGVYETARYDLKTLKCLNQPKVQVTSQYRTAFYPYYPAYGKYVSLEHTCGDGNILCHDASYEGSMFGNLALQTPPPPGQPRFVKDAAREFLRRRGRGTPKPQKIWEDKLNRRFTSFVVSSDQFLATGHPDGQPKDAFLVAANVKGGADVWLKKLPAIAVKGGTAIDGQGRIFVTLENGQLLCYSE